MQPDVQAFYWCLFVIFLAVVFSFIAVLSTSSNRRREREAFYRGETLKKIAEMQGDGANHALELLREQEKLLQRRRSESRVLSGLITMAVGFALLIFMGVHVGRHGHGVFLIALIPIFVGAVLWWYGRSMAAAD
jgi:Flp pilus assembly protein TadB